MRNPTRTCVVLTTLAIASASVSCGPKPQYEPDSRADDEAAVRAADIAWSEAADSRDLEAVVSYYTDDVVVLPPNMPAVVGREAARELSHSMMAVPGYSVKWQPEQVEVARSGDIGFARGSYVLTITGPDGSPLIDKGKYLEVWKKQADGTWKVALEALNSDLPAGPASPLPAQE